MFVPQNMGKTSRLFCFHVQFLFGQQGEGVSGSRLTPFQAAPAPFRSTSWIHSYNQPTSQIGFLDVLDPKGKQHTRTKQQQQQQQQHKQTNKQTNKQGTNKNCSSDTTTRQHVLLPVVVVLVLVLLLVVLVLVGRCCSGRSSSSRRSSSSSTSSTSSTS